MISLHKFSWVLLHCWVLSLLLFGAHGDGSVISVNFTEAPNSTSHLNSPSFPSDVSTDGKLASQWGYSYSYGYCTSNCTGSDCTSNCTGSAITCPCSVSNNTCPCSVSDSTCQLDYCTSTYCGGKEVSYRGFQDGNLKFEVCSVASPGAGCSTYGWIVDGRTELLHVSSADPKDLVPLDGGNMTLVTTNNNEDLKVYLNFSGPVLSSRTEVLNSLHTSQGTLVPIPGEIPWNNTFGFQVVNVSSFALINITFDPSSVRTGSGKCTSPIKPVIFLYDSRRPQVRLSSTSTRTRKPIIPVFIDFSKTVLGFNKSHLSILGGRLFSFEETNSSTKYFIQIQAHDDVVSINVPENATEDVFGNKNRAVALEVRHYSVPVISRVTSSWVTSAFGITYLAQGLVAVSTASPMSTGEIPGVSSSLMSNTAGNLLSEYYEFAKGLEWSIPYFNLPWEKDHVSLVNLSSEFHLSEINQNGQPKEVNLHKASNMVQTSRQWRPSAGDYESTFGSVATKIAGSKYSDSLKVNCWEDFNGSMFWLAVIGGSLIFLHALVILIIRFKWPKIQGHLSEPQKQRDYGALTFPRFEIFLLILALPCICKASAGLVRGGERSGIIVGSVLLGVVGLLLLSFFLFLLVGVTIGLLLRYHEDYLIHYNQDHQEHQESYCHRYIGSIRRIILGPDLRSEWTCRNESNQIYKTIFGPLFEDLRGLCNRQGKAEASGGNPSKRGESMNASNDEKQNVGAPGGNPHRNGEGIIASEDKTGDRRGPDEDNPHKHGDRVIASDDKTEDASLIQKLFGILRTYYTLLDSMRLVILAILVDESPKSPTIVIILSITCFQLFFLFVAKPFRCKRNQLVEIISVACEVVTFTLLLLEQEKICSESKIGTFMVLLPSIGYSAQLINQGYVLYKQIKDLDKADDKTFRGGLARAFSDLGLYLIPLKLMEKLGGQQMKRPREPL